MDADCFTVKKAKQFKQQARFMTSVYWHAIRIFKIYCLEAGKTTMGEYCAFMINLTKKFMEEH